MPSRPFVSWSTGADGEAEWRMVTPAACWALAFAARSASLASRSAFSLAFGWGLG